VEPQEEEEEVEAAISRRASKGRGRGSLFDQEAKYAPPPSWMYDVAISERFEFVFVRASQTYNIKRTIILLVVVTH